MGKILCLMSVGYFPTHRLFTKPRILICQRNKMTSVEAEPPQKKQKVDATNLDIHSRIKNERMEVAESVMDFKFNKKRVEMISKATDVPDGSQGIVYWMSREQRVQDNWALLFAQRLAMKNNLSLHVAFCLVPKFLDATYRMFDFMLKGLEEVADECKELGIEFHLLIGEAKVALPNFIKSHNIGGVVTDFCPLRVPQQWVKDVKNAIPSNIPMCRVDARNIVPCQVASDKQEYSAKTIRKKIHDKLPTFLTNFPPVVKHPHESKIKAEPVDWIAADKYLECDRSVGPVSWAKPGTKAGLTTLNDFCLKRLRKYGIKSNDPTENALSNLSPWIHFGQVSAQRCVLEVTRYKKQLKEQVDSFVEQMVVRRELTDNYCFYQKDYDNINGAYAWARTTLNDHRKDKRPYLYTRETLEEAKTHDELWNSAQIQLIKEGKMHGFLRMYWAKKILEWTASPEEALATCIYLNDRYNLDGRDPNGYVGCMWSICGIHDQGWGERPIFGKIRYMNYDGCKRKFKIEAFVARYGGKKHKYIPPVKG
ncbi:deoxyribodipyrimidine photo-lyase-like isoform X1 [Macrobrachium rosenbergii]|uniref:deoxyribodipyrimidine photo-lyase-like isoform X1 n=3 Tax=Macrobrachium rosenbergii TaxID=79674 RepID=UPI0034D77237